MTEWCQMIIGLAREQLGCKAPVADQGSFGTRWVGPDPWEFICVDIGKGGRVHVRKTGGKLSQKAPLADWFPCQSVNCRFDRVWGRVVNEFCASWASLMRGSLCLKKTIYTNMKSLPDTKSYLLTKPYVKYCECFVLFDNGKSIIIAYAGGGSH